MRIARSVANGEVVDWKAEALEDPESNEQIEQLRTLEGIAAAHRIPLATGSSVTKPPAGPAYDTPTRPVPASPAGPTRWGKLRIIEKIAEGGFATVYRAYDPTLQRDVALKLPRPDRARARFQSRRSLEEARRLARVCHDNVVVVHGAEEHDGNVGLWTDLLEGETLEQCLEKRGTFGAREAALIGIDLCRALAAVHRAGLIHRDVKTSNVMRVTGGRIVLMDFSAVSERFSLPGRGGRESVSGTLHYMAPELFRGEDSGIAVDIYALGVVLYRLVSTCFPVEADSLPELVSKHERGESTPVLDVRPDLPPGLVRAIGRALDPDPAKRYQSPGQMEHDLSAVVGTQPPVFPPRLKSGFWSSRRGIAAAAAAIMLAVGSLVVSRLTRPAPLEVEAALYRMRAGVEERLPHGGIISPGDDLFLEIRGSAAMHVYIVNEDMRGGQAVLFPLPGLELQNPLTRGTHRLPGRLDGLDHGWTVTSSGGSELVSVLASREPMAGLEQILAGGDQATPGAPIEVTGEMIDRLRGIAGLAPAETGDLGPTPQPRRLLSAAYRDLFSGRDDPEIWFWEIELRNPGGVE